VLHSWRWPRAATTCPSVDHARARTAAARIPLNGYDPTGRVDAKYFYLNKRDIVFWLTAASLTKRARVLRSSEAMASSSMGG
jgi:hypothetical protein